MEYPSEPNHYHLPLIFPLRPISDRTQLVDGAFFPYPRIMASGDHTSSSVELYESGLTVRSDSENYSANNELSESTSSSPLILYKPPTIWSILRGAAINLVLPFVNGLMLGFGELFAHEAAFRLGWSGTKVRLPDRFLLCTPACKRGLRIVSTDHANTVILPLDFPYLSEISRSWCGGSRSSITEE